MYAKREVTTRGIVLSRPSAGEGSIRVLLYTEDLGLVSALAKSGREERSKLRAHLQSGTVGTFSLVKGRDVWRVTGAVETQNAHFSLLDKTAQEAAARILMSMRQFVRGEGADLFLFKTLYGFLESLPSVDSELILPAESIAALRLFAALGYVRRDAFTEEFLMDEGTYGAHVLARAAEERQKIVRTINEAISASGL